MKRIAIVVLLLLMAGSNARATDRFSAGSIRPADPPTREMKTEMIGWTRLYRQEMAPVRHAWSGLVEAIHQGRISDLSQICPAFQEGVAGLERGPLLRGPDPVIRTWLGRGIGLLEDAAVRCHRDRFFALGFRLYQAGHVIRAVDRRVLLYQ